MNLTRRAFARAALAAAAAPALAGLAGCAGAGGEKWTAEQDDSLNVLTFQVSGGSVVALPGEGWAARDGWIQLQLAGGSIPGAEIESVARAGSVLTVTLKAQDGPQTMDLLLTEYRLAGGDASTVETVKVDHGGGDVRELERALD